MMWFGFLTNSNCLFVPFPCHPSNPNVKWILLITSKNRDAELKAKYINRLFTGITESVCLGISLSLKYHRTPTEAQYAIDCPTYIDWHQAWCLGPVVCSVWSLSISSFSSVSLITLGEEDQVQAHGTAESDTVFLHLCGIPHGPGWLQSQLCLQ